jgi:hypothetical protein
MIGKDRIIGTSLHFSIIESTLPPKGNHNHNQSMKKHYINKSKTSIDFLPSHRDIDSSPIPASDIETHLSIGLSTW